MSTHLLTDAEALVMARILRNVHERRATEKATEGGRTDQGQRQNPTEGGDEDE